MQNLSWLVYDVTNDTVVGRWNDISYAEEFAFENEGEDDCWAVFHELELLQVPA